MVLLVLDGHMISIHSEHQDHIDQCFCFALILLNHKLFNPYINVDRCIVTPLISPQHLCVLTCSLSFTSDCYIHYH